MPGNEEKDKKTSACDIVKILFSVEDNIGKI
jgi:hypothetical protein